jgi:hypothetical protein
MILELSGVECGEIEHQLEVEEERGGKTHIVNLIAEGLNLENNQ